MGKHIQLKFLCIEISSEKKKDQRSRSACGMIQRERERKNIEISVEGCCRIANRRHFDAYLCKKLSWFVFKFDNYLCKELSWLVFKLQIICLWILKSTLSSYFPGFVFLGRK